MQTQENHALSLIYVSSERPVQQYNHGMNQSNLEYGLLAPPLDELFPPSKKIFLLWRKN